MSKNNDNPCKYELFPTSNHNQKEEYNQLFPSKEERHQNDHQFDLFPTVNKADTSDQDKNSAKVKKNDIDGAYTSRFLSSSWDTDTDLVSRSTIKQENSSQVIYIKPQEEHRKTSPTTKKKLRELYGMKIEDDVQKCDDAEEVETVIKEIMVETNPFNSADLAIPPRGKNYSQLSLENQEIALDISPSLPAQVHVFEELFPRSGYISRMGQPYVRHKFVEYQKGGNATDIVLVKNADGKYFSSPWHVAFSWSIFKASHVGEMIDVYINKYKINTVMVMGEKGRCFFPGGSITPSSEDLSTVPIFDNDINKIHIEHRRTRTIRYIDCKMYVWGCDDSVVIADLDGTITISDIEGHIRTLRLGQYDFIHEGACSFFSKLHEIGCRILYLTARPIDWATASRVHLDNATQKEHKLPPGPLITNFQGLTAAFMTEIVNKNPHIFKADALNELAGVVLEGGRVSEYPLYVAGFGNRPTDVQAYMAAGIDESMIFLINPDSNVTPASSTDVFESYSDPKCLLWLLPKLKRKMPFKFVEKIDMYTSREIVIAEEMLQMRLSHQVNHRFQRRSSSIDGISPRGSNNATSPKQNFADDFEQLPRFVRSNSK